MTNHTPSREAVLIRASELRERLDDDQLVILDIRFRQDPTFDGRRGYLEGHLPGAVAVDFAEEITGPSVGYSGKRPLPPLPRLQHDARRWGIRANSDVVLYDDNQNRQAARVWWTLKWAGVASVRLLDGGLQAWGGEGGRLDTTVPFPVRGNVDLDADTLPLFGADEAALFVQDGLLIDARDAASFRAGHIPGAINLPAADNIDAASGQYLETDALMARFDAAGIDGTKPIGVYCGGGVAASHQIAALTAVGLSASLFPGSWSAWSANPSRPKETGA